MTLTVVKTLPDHAVILTDSLTTVESYRDIQTSHDKVLTLAHLDAAVTSRGDCNFGKAWRELATEASSAVTSFDGFVDLIARSAEAFRDVVEKAYGSGNGRDMAILVGYSESAGAFRALRFGPSTSWSLDELEPDWCVPVPLEFRPSRHEADLRHRDARFEGLLDEWLANPPLTIEETAEGFGYLLGRCWLRAAMPLASGLKVPWGGQVWATTIGRGQIFQQLVADYPVTSWRLALIARGTYHPWGQAGPCFCGSGQRSLDCCMQKVLDEDCWCESGVKTRDCCMLSDSAEIARAALELRGALREMPPAVVEQLAEWESL